MRKIFALVMFFLFSCAAIAQSNDEGLKADYTRLFQAVKNLSDQILKMLDRDVSVVKITAHGWKSDFPQELPLGIDGDEKTATSYGQTSMVGNNGFIEMELKEAVQGTAYIKFSFLSPNDKHNASWTIDTSADGQHWTQQWYLGPVHAPHEAIMELAVPIWGRFVRLSSHDIGQGAAKTRLYEIKVRKG